MPRFMDTMRQINTVPFGVRYSYTELSMNNEPFSPIHGVAALHLNEVKESVFTYKGILPRNSHAYKKRLSYVLFAPDPFARSFYSASDSFPNSSFIAANQLLGFLSDS